MILAEKIMSLRKQNGWSQEELAEQLEVSRQSVSKWESGNSIPDIEKIIKMSQLFYVSTDYLLKDTEDDGTDIPATIVNIESVDQNGHNEIKQISMEFASEFVDTTKAISKKFAAAVSACVLSPVVILVLGAMAESGKFNISEGVAAAIGLLVLFGMVAAAVMVFILDGMKLSKYEFLEKEPIKLMYGVEAVVNRYKEIYEPTFRICIATGVILCILSVVPIVVGASLGADDFICAILVAILLVIVSIGVFLFVSSGMVYGSYQKLLQLDEYNPEIKRNNEKYGKVYGAYWCLATAGYLAWSFITGAWDFTWIVWPVVGVLFVPIKLIIEAIGNKS